MTQSNRQGSEWYFLGFEKVLPILLWQKEYNLITDHKPLVFILHPQKALPTVFATRILKYAHFLLGFDFTIEFRCIADHSNVEFLSRYPHKKSQNFVHDHSI